MSAVERGVVLDAETAALVRKIATTKFSHGGFTAPVYPGDILTHIGGRPVAELVAEADQADADAEALREVADEYLHLDHLHDLAARIDERRAKAIDPRLVAAAHAQWADTEEVERG